MADEIPLHCTQFLAAQQFELNRKTLLEITDRCRAAWGALLQASNYAEDSRRIIWDFAVEIGTLYQAGMTTSDLRWLVCNGILSHGVEITRHNSDVREFRDGSNLRFGISTCFVITEKGRSFVDRMDQAPPTPTLAPCPTCPVRNPQSIPIWDAQRKEIRFGTYLVKQFKVPAANQETILATFEEEGWPPRIDDPLPPLADQDPKRRLNSTINALNRHHRHILMRFLGDGSGLGVRWERASRNGDGPLDLVG